MRRLATLGLLLALSACHSRDSRPRTVVEEDNFSFVDLKGFESTRDRGATILRPTDKKLEGSTLVIRSVRLDERHDRTPEAVLEATEVALKGMPSATVSDAKDVEDSELPGKVFAVTFNPPGKGGKTYERTHVVLFGDERVYHVLHTAPKGHLGDIAKDAKKLIETLEEEG